MSTGSPGSGTEIIAVRVLRAAGLDPDGDVTRQGLGVSESAGALKDGKIAAFFWSGGLPSAAVQDLAHTTGITIRMIPTGDLVAGLQQEYGALYFGATVPAAAYRGHRRRGSGRRRRQRAGRQRLDARAARLRHHAAAVRETGGAVRRSIRKPAISPSSARPSAARRHFTRRPSGSIAKKARGSRSRRGRTGRDAHAGRMGRARGGPAVGVSCGLRPLLGAVHRPASGLSRQFPARCADPHIPAVSSERQTKGRACSRGRLAVDRPRGGRARLAAR